MFRLKRLSTGDVMVICESDGKAAEMIYAPYVEAVSQALGIGIPVKGVVVDDA